MPQPEVPAKPEVPAVMDHSGMPVVPPLPPKDARDAIGNFRQINETSDTWREAVKEFEEEEAEGFEAGVCQSLLYGECAPCLHTPPA